jgi:hypothetical protein
VSVTAAALFVRHDDRERVTAVLVKELERRLKEGKWIPRPRLSPAQELEKASDGEGARFLVIDSEDGWVQVVENDGCDADFPLGRVLSGTLETPVVAYEMAAHVFAWRFVRWENGVEAERAASPAVLFEADAASRAREPGALRFEDVEALGHAWLLDLGLPAGRLHLREEDLKLGDEEPGSSLAGVKLKVALPAGPVSSEPFVGRIAHGDGDVPMRPTVYVPGNGKGGAAKGIIVEPFLLPCALDVEGARSLIEAFDRRAARYVHATGARVRFLIGFPAAKAALRRELARMRGFLGRKRRFAFELA